MKQASNLRAALVNTNNTDPENGCFRPLYGIALYQAVGWNINEHVFIYFLPVISIALLMIGMLIYCIAVTPGLPIFTPTSLTSMAVAIKEAGDRFQFEPAAVSLDPSDKRTRAVTVVYQRDSGSKEKWSYCTVQDPISGA